MPLMSIFNRNKLHSPVIPTPVIYLIHKSYNALVRYPKMHHSGRKCAHLFSESCIVSNGTGTLWDLRGLVYYRQRFHYNHVTWAPWRLK